MVKVLLPLTIIIVVVIIIVIIAIIIIIIIVNRFQPTGLSIFYIYMFSLM